MSPASYLLLVFIAVCAVSTVYGDVYLHNFRGSNNRLRETGADAQQQNRLFDSENNARGGYCWGPELTYYEGSIISLEWTAQHACGNDNTQCNIVLQYMCTSDADGDDETLMIRDGANIGRISTDTNPASGDYYNRKNEDGEFHYGMHEPMWVYTQCSTRLRNGGLFLGAETLNGNTAMFTRQNAGGGRSGLECSEERDYWPYWHPSVWKDIAVLTDDDDQCDFFQKESQNVKPKHYCNGTDNAAKRANNEDECLRSAGSWETFPAWGIKKPACKKAEWSRDNHLGNGVTGYTNSYNWTIPREKDEPCITQGNCTCVFRIRYNITVGEVSWTDDSTKNGVRSPTQDNPLVEVDGHNYTIALDTAQTGRTFQDRSHMWRIASRPKGVSKSAKIYNLNVRGKRGNIVQSFPATEYDFVPTFLEVEENDFIHFQWTGCDTNPGNYAGQGTAGTDRSNIVQIADMGKNYPLNDTELSKHKLLFKNEELRIRMAHQDQKDCLSYADLQAAGGNIDQNVQNCFRLNAAPQRFSGALVKMETPGSYYYMSTRNNNFSNRSQKGSIKVSKWWKDWMTAVTVVSVVAGVAVGAAVGGVVYAKHNPMSGVAEFVKKVPGINKI